MALQNGRPVSQTAEEINGQTHDGGEATDPVA